LIPVQSFGCNGPGVGNFRLPYFVSWREDNLYVLTPHGFQLDRFDLGSGERETTIGLDVQPSTYPHSCLNGDKTWDGYIHKRGPVLRLGDARLLNGYGSLHYRNPDSTYGHQLTLPLPSTFLGSCCYIYFTASVELKDSYLIVSHSSPVWFVIDQQDEALVPVVGALNVWPSGKQLIGLGGAIDLAQVQEVIEPVQKKFREEIRAHYDRFGILDLAQAIDLIRRSAVVLRAYASNVVFEEAIHLRDDGLDQLFQSDRGKKFLAAYRSYRNGFGVDDVKQARDEFLDAIRQPGTTSFLEWYLIRVVAR
jgi:hypothetical protein